MAQATIQQIKEWFRTHKFPTQQQFWDTWDSFWHKDEKIPAGQIDGLQQIFQGITDGWNNALAQKQDTLTAGNGITIEGNVISATGGSDNFADGHYYTYDAASEIAKIIPYYRSEDGLPYDDPFCIAGYGFGNAQYQFYDTWVGMRLKNDAGQFFLKDQYGYLGLFNTTNQDYYASSLQFFGSNAVSLRRNGQDVLFGNDYATQLSYMGMQVFIASMSGTYIRNYYKNQDVLSFDAYSDVLQLSTGINNTCFVSTNRGSQADETSVRLNNCDKFVATGQSGTTNDLGVWINLFGYGHDPYSIYGGNSFDAVFEAISINGGNDFWTTLRYATNSFDGNVRKHNVILEAGTNSGNPTLSLYCGDVGSSGNSDETHKVIRAFPGILEIGTPNASQTGNAKFVDFNTQSSLGSLSFYDPLNQNYKWMSVHNSFVTMNYPIYMQNGANLIFGNTSDIVTQNNTLYPANYQNKHFSEIITDLHNRIAALEAA